MYEATPAAAPIEVVPDRIPTPVANDSSTIPAKSESSSMPASTAATTGWTINSCPLTKPTGLVLNTSRVATTSETSTSDFTEW